MLEQIDYLGELLSVGINAKISHRGDDVTIEFSNANNDVLYSFSGEYDYCVKSGYNLLRWIQ
jgi:hypothetical protein